MNGFIVVPAMLILLVAISFAIMAYLNSRKTKRMARILFGVIARMSESRRPGQTPSVPSPDPGGSSTSNTGRWLD